MVRSQNITDKQAYIRELYCKEEIDFTHVFQTAEDKVYSLAQKKESYLACYYQFTKQNMFLKLAL